MEGAKGFPGGPVIKNLPADKGDARDVGLIPGLGRSPGEGNVYALQYSCLENSIDRGAIEKYQCPKGKETGIASTKHILLFNLFFTRILIIVQRTSGSITG